VASDPKPSNKLSDSEEEKAEASEGETDANVL
jgi:hypothetical protein